MNTRSKILIIGFLFISFHIGSALEDNMDEKEIITLFMCGDIMTGRGIDQILPHPNDPRIYEPYMKDATGYVKIAESVNGPIQIPVKYSYIWGEALKELEQVDPDLRIINLETSITASNDYWKGKGINYRMHPENIQCLTAAGIDYCSLGNNHVIDWGYSGLRETIETLEEVNIQYAGAGHNLKEAETPAVMNISGKWRVLIFSYGSPTSGIPISWAAETDKPGVNLLKNLHKSEIRNIQKKIEEVKQPGDIVIVSLHWGSNWGYEIPLNFVQFAHGLIDEASVDIIHGHSSHHVRPIELYKNKLILYGCGDFLNDYEGISGHETYRADLVLMYFADVDPVTGNLVHLQMTPMQIRNFKVNKATREDGLWLRDRLNDESEMFGTHIEINEDNRLILKMD